MEEGLEKGIRKGVEKGKAEIVRNLITDLQITDEQIAAIAGVSPEFVKKVRESTTEK